MRSFTRYASRPVSAFRRWLMPPIAGDEAAQHVISLADRLLLATVGAWWIGLLLLAVFRTGHRPNLLIGLGASLLLLGVRELLRRRLTVLSVTLGVALGWTVFTLYLYNLGTPYSVHLLGYMAVVIFGAWVGGARAGWAIALLSGITVYALARAATAGLLPSVAAMSSAALTVDLVAYLVICTLLISLTRANFIRALRLAYDEVALRREAEAALRRSEANLAAAQRIARLGSWEMDLVTGEQRWSAEIYRIFHVNPADPPSTRAAMWQAIHPQDVNRIQTALARLFDTGERFNVVFRLTFPDGEVSLVHGEAEATLDETGRPVHVLGTVKDITEQERAKEALQRSEAMLAEAERIAHIGSWRIDLATGEMVLSDELRRVFGFGPEMHSFTLRDIDRIIHPDDLPAVHSARMHALESAPAYGIRYRIVRADGEMRVLDARGEIHRNAAGQPTHVYVVVQDVTERARAEAAVAERVRQLTTLHELSQPVSLRLPVNEIVHTYLERLIEAPGFDMARLYLLQGEALRCLDVCSRVPLPVEPEPLLAVGECLIGLAVQHGRLEYAPEIEADPRCSQPSCRGQGIRSMAALPLRSTEAILGVLAIGSTAQDAFADQSGFLDTIAGLVAGRLQNALLYQETRDRAAGLEETVAERTRELQAERDRTQAILETVGESVVVADVDGCVLYANPATLRLTGATRDEMLGQPLWQYWSGRMFMQMWPQVQEALVAGRSWQGDVLGARKDGTSYDAALTATPLCDESSTAALCGSVWVQRDITAVKQAERLKDRFVSNVSHELRTPISVIGLSCDNLETFKDRLSESDRRQMLTDIHVQAHTLNTLIEDILTLSQIDSGRGGQPWQEVDLARLVREQAERQRPIADGRSQEVSVSAAAPVPVQGSAIQLQQIVRNLLDNAIKYTPPGGKIRCTCEVRSGAGDSPVSPPDAAAPPLRAWAVIEITDTGIGVPADAIPLLFERFYRVHDEGEVPGTGLGLSIARELTLLHGGQIKVTSTPGEGSTFTVCLPLHDGQHTAAE